MGDLLVNNVEGWRKTKRCERNEKIYVTSFIGATVNEMKHYKPTAKSKPNSAILYVGANDLRNKNQSEAMLAQEIFSLATSIQTEKIDVTISGIVGRIDEHKDERRRVNLILTDMCREREIRYVDQINIDPLNYLNRSHVHLNRSGDIIFEDNLVIA